MVGQTIVLCGLSFRGPGDSPRRRQATKTDGLSHLKPSHNSKVNIIAASRCVRRKTGINPALPRYPIFIPVSEAPL